MINGVLPIQTVPAGGEMAGRIRTHDWSATKLGPRDAWPMGLASTVDLIIATPIGMVVLWGPDGLMVYNDGYVPIAGTRHPEALGQSARTVWPEIWAWNERILDQAFRGEALTYRDQPMTVLRNGHPEDVWFDLFYTPLRDDDGHFAGVLCTVIETTAHVIWSRRALESEERLARSEARLSMLVNQASVGIAQSDLEGRLVSVNDRFSAIVGRTADDLVDQLVEDLTFVDDREAGRIMATRLLETGEPITIEKRLVRPDGTIVWVSNHVSLARNAAGQPDFVIRIVQDVSDRKEAETRASESTERIELALGAGVILGTWSWNVVEDRFTADARFARTFGIPPADAAVGFPLATALEGIHPDDRGYVSAAIDACLRDGGPYRAEYRVRQDDGSWLWIEANGHCERDADGKAVRFPGVLIDIGHRRNAAERQAFLIQLGDQLRTLDKPDLVMSRTVEATARHLQAGTVGFGEASADGRWIDLLAAWSRHGAAPLGRFPTTDFGSAAADLLRQGDACLFDGSPIIDHVAVGNAIGSGIAVPLLREGRWHATIFAAGPPGRVWRDAEADLLREVIGRTWEAVERARAVETLRKAQGRQAFLLRLNDHLSEIHDHHEVVETVAEGLGAYLAASRVIYGELGDDKVIGFAGEWTDGSVPAITGPFPYEGLLDEDMAQLARGLTISADDLLAREVLDPAFRASLERHKLRATLAIPLIRDGRLRAALFLFQATPRRWSLEEISLAQEVARRTWDALERTRAEEALQRSEARLRAMFDTLPVGIVFAEMPSGRVTEGNARVDQILGSARIPVTSETAYEDWVAFDEDGQRVPIENHPLYIAVTTGEISTRVFHHQRSDGTRVWISVIGAPVRDAEGRTTGGLVTIVDIDREKRADEALRELNATLEQQVEVRTRERDRVWRNSRDLLAVMGLDGVLHSVNPSWTSLLGWAAEDLAGKRFAEFVHKDDVAPTFAAIESLRQGRLTAPFENRYHARNDGYRWYSWTASLYGDTVYMNGRDVTAEKDQAQQLLQAEDQLRQSQKMEAVGQLTGGIAHDFNNLLTGITGALDLLAKRIEQNRLERAPHYIEMAMTSANRAASLTHRLLAFSRRQPLEAKPVDANRLVQSMDDLLRRTLGEGITLDLIIEPKLWLTLCDQHQLENALLNLVINARDAMPDGGRLTIETANVTLDKAYAIREAGVSPGAYVMVAVSDTGTGMSADVIARAFDPFFTTKPIGQGTGLGLSMIYGFAKQSEGTVKIESEIDVGTTVKLFVPRYLGEIAEVGESRGEPPRAEAGETVLIVEDDATVRLLVLEVLRDLGYRTLEAEDGPSGLRVLDSSEHIDLLVTDVGLPGLNGRQLADRARELRKGLKVLFITGYAENAAFGTGHLDTGMQMITKPFAVDVLATKIREMIASR